MKTIDAKRCTVIALGRLGENEYTVVRFDVSAWLSEYPEAVIGLYNQRPSDNAAYPVAGISVDGGIASWTVTSAELTQTGEGKCELVAIAGEVLAKSAIFRTMVFDALDGSGEAPEPWEEWQQQLIILKNEAEQAADRAEEAVEHYPRIVDGVWEVWDAQAGVYVSTGVQAQGPQGVPGGQGETGEPGPQGEPGPTGQTGPAGAPGISPSITITDITGGHRVTITDADGDHSFDVMDGEDGQGIPTGGTAGQILEKTSGADYAVSWADKNPVVQVPGTTPSITALPGIQYICGECATLDITLPASGCIDVVFQSGSTPTVLTVTPPSGQTVKWTNGFDPTALEANTTYEINIKDGLGVAVSWT